MRPRCNLISLATTTVLLSLFSPPLPVRLSTQDKAISLTLPPLPVTAQTIPDRKAEEDRVLQQCRQDLRNSQYEAAVKSCEQALTTFRQLKNRSGEVKALNNLGVAYFSLNDYTKAIIHHEQSLTIARELKDRIGEGRSLDNLGNAHNALQNYDKAIAYYQQALPIFMQVKDKNGEARALTHLGNAYRSLSQYDKAIAYYQQALPIFVQVKDKNGEARVLTNLGVACRSLSQYDKAIAYYQQALPIFMQIKDKNGEANVLTNLGVAYWSLSQHDKAIAYYQQALPIFVQVKDKNGEANALMNLGNAYQYRSQYDKAIAYYQQALPIFMQVKDKNGEAKALMNLGVAYLALSQYDKAIAYYQQARPLYQQVKDKNGEAKALMNLGEAYRNLSQYEEAIAYYQQALPIYQQVKDREGEGLLLSNMGDLFQRQSQPELAIVFYKQSVTVRETIRADLRSLSRDLQESYTQSVAGTYRALADLLIDQGRIGEAQQVLERLKIQEINDFTKGTRAAAAVPEVGFNATESQIKTKHTGLIAFGGKLYDCEQTRCAQLNALKTEYRNLSKEFQDFVESIKKQLKEGRLVTVDKATDDFQNSADRVVTAHSNSILIYPLVLSDKTRLLWAGKGGVLSKTAVCPLGEKALYGKVNQFRQLLMQPDSAKQLRTVGKELYDCLVKPLEPELTANGIKHLIFVPDRATNYIPMAALHDGNQYLIQRFAISTVLSAGLTDTDTRLPNQPQQVPTLGLGLSEARGNFSALPNVVTELNAIVKTGTSDTNGIFPGLKFLNRAFDRNALETNLQGHKILHIATHGKFKPSNPRDSYFLLGTGDRYAIPDIQSLRELRDVHLVVLSACETGLGGADGLGLEIAGMSSYFLGDRDRAKAVLASLWVVNDASTSLLMQRFYQNLATGKMTKAEALRQAQLSLLQGTVSGNEASARSLGVIGEPGVRPSQGQASPFSHPYHWAPFILIGNSL